MRFMTPLVVARLTISLTISFPKAISAFLIDVPVDVFGSQSHIGRYIFGRWVY